EVTDLDSGCRRVVAIRGTEEPLSGAGPKNAHEIGAGPQPLADYRDIAHLSKRDGHDGVAGEVVVAGIEEPLSGAGPENTDALGAAPRPVAFDRDVSGHAKRELTRGAEAVRRIGIGQEIGAVARDADGVARHIGGQSAKQAVVLIVDAGGEKERVAT